MRRNILNINLPKGISRTVKGHLRYTSPKEMRGKYVHRVVMEKLLDETPFSVKILLPYPYEVHHQDYNKQNNDPLNLLLVDICLHSSMTADRPRRMDGRWGYVPHFKPAPYWALFKDDIEGVPF